MQELKVSAKSSPNAVAGALAACLRDDGEATLACVGAGAVNQAVKAAAIASGFVAPQGIELVMRPAFKDILMDGEERTSVRLICEDRFAVR